MEAHIYNTKYGVFRVSENDKKIRHEFETKNEHQGKELEWLIPLVPEGGKVLDVGAHIGTFSVPFSQKAYVTACEPHPNSFKLLEENIKRNGARVEAYNVAVGNEGVSYLSTPKNDAGSRLAAVGEYQVNVVPLDNFCDAYDLIKIDVEGKEYEVLKSGKRTLAHEPLIFFEVGDNITFFDKIRIDWLLRKYAFYRWNLRKNEVERIFSVCQVSFGDVLAVPPRYRDKIDLIREV